MVMEVVEVLEVLEVLEVVEVLEAVEVLEVVEVLGGVEVLEVVAVKVGGAAVGFVFSDFQRHPHHQRPYYLPLQIAFGLLVDHDDGLELD